MLPWNYPRGEIFRVEVGVPEPPFVRHEKRRGKRRAGELYEQRVHEALICRYPGYIPSPWVSFQDERGEKYCQPDALLVDPRRGCLTIVEVKLQHTHLAEQALFRLYLPVLRQAFAGFYRLSVLEVCRWYDPANVGERAHALCRDPERAREGAFNIHILAV